MLLTPMTNETIAALLKEMNAKLKGKPYSGTTLDYIQDTVENACITYEPADIANKNFLTCHDYGQVHPDKDNQYVLYHTDTAVLTVHFKLDDSTGIGSMKFGAVTAIRFHEEGTTSA